MSRRRTIIRLSAVLASLALGWACGGDSATAPPTPEPARPTTVTVSPATHGLTALGATVQLSAEVRDQNARVMAGATVTWTSSANSVATVDASGLVTAAGNGTATITASAGPASGSSVVTVMQSVASVEVSPSVDELTALGQTVQLTAEAFDENGYAVAGAEFSWESSDAAVATVDAGGLVTGVAAGMATITASAGEASGSSVVTVTQSVASVEVSPSVDELTALGQTVQLTAEAFDENGYAVAGAEFSWESSDAAVATVDAGGLVTGVAAGMATITASAGEASGSSVVTVMQSGASVEVSPSAQTIALGSTLQLTAEAFDENGDAVAGAEFSWESSDAAVATVDAGGLVTGVAAGMATITASAGEASGSAVVTVTQSVASVEVSPSVDELTALGQTVQLTAEAFDENGYAVAGAEFSWESSDAAVATVDAGGLVTGVAAGMATITASAGEASGSSVVTVTQSVASVEVSPSVDELTALGQTVQLTAEAFDENGEAVAGVEFSWESSDAAIATADDGGLVTGVAVGTATITASVGGAQGTAEITVGPNPDRAALVALYEATDGQNWVNSENWLTDEPLDRWYGIRMGSYGRVTRLHLSENALSGPIPPELGELTHLTVLALFRNQLGGKIPPELGELTRLTELILSGNQLSGPIPPELGNLANLRVLALASNSLTGPIPSELGNLANLEQLGLEQNLLSGPVPPELGNLVKLTWLALVVNKLSGPLPRSLLQLKRLQWLTVRGNATLCVPGTSSFITWLRGIDQQDGDRAFCNAADRVALTSLYDSGGGSSWTNSDGWLGDGALSQWHGITADLVGRVVRLDLTRNGLAGGLPANLGRLASMTNLRIGDNALSGRLPLSLARLPLQELRFADTELCAPTEESFQAWLNAISVVEGTGVRCAPVSDRDILEALYAAAGGPNWTNNRNWLSGTPLRNWYGVSVDARGRVTGLNLSSNNLSGPIPAELGSLANLTSLDLGSNNLSGPIPSELGQLANLRTLQLASNNLSGPIPPQLGNLANLETLELYLTQLSGSIPPELGNLTNLSRLQLFGNLHVGQIPPELGNLANLRVLALASNSLTGPIPSELGNLANLRRLALSSSGLSGPIPPELGRLARLENLRLARNDLTGSIPSELGNLASLTELDLFRNNLSGPIPPELGNLVNLTQINLFNNALSGSIPVTLGRLVNVRGFRLSDNGLTGPIPPELGGLSSVETLWLNGTGCRERSHPKSVTSPASRISDCTVTLSPVLFPPNSAISPRWNKCS